MSEITIHALLSHQEDAASSPARFKVLRCGRRWGKTAFAENVSLLGHGPEDGNGVPQHLGMIHGLDVVWLAPTIPQANIMWKTDVVPRFKHREGLKVNENDKTVEILNPDGSTFSTLWVRSAEAPKSIRGIGRKLGGVITDESAWFDLEYLWRDVLRPTLMDCGGWAIIMSTTNGGPDGHETAEGKRTPSFFNILCEQIQNGTRGEEWAEFYGTAADNPKIRPEEFEALIKEYPPDSVTLQQEVFAKLVIGGAGVAFPEWSDDAHIARFEPPRDSGAWTGFGDWGYAKPGGLWLQWTGPERSLCRWEYYFREKTPYDVGYNFGKQIQRFPKPEWIAVDTPAVSDGGPTILEELQRGLNDACGGLTNNPPVFINPPKGPGSRQTKLQLAHEAMKYTRLQDRTIPVWGYPAQQFHPDCSNIIRTLQRLPRDPKGKEDVDTSAEDHPYDGWSGWLMARIPHVQREQQANRNPDDHPGWDDKGKRADRTPTVAEVAGVSGGSRWTRWPGRQ